MKLSVFLEDIKQNQESVVYYCCNHLLSKKFDVINDDVEDDVLKSYRDEKKSYNFRSKKNKKDFRNFK